jgi:alkaline phosphatase
MKTRFVKLLVFLTVLALQLAVGLSAALAEPVKHIILFIGDGMHLEHEIAASRYLSGEDRNLVFHDFDYHCYMSTWDVTTYNQYAQAAGKPEYDRRNFDPRLGYDPARGGEMPFPEAPDIEDAYFLTKINGSYPATDSASAGTAWATGYKTDEGNIAWLPGDPENGGLETIAEKVRRKRDFAIGVVSTVPFSHATPAVHVSHNISRNNYHAIAQEILTQIKPEVVIGGGHPTWAKTSSGEGRFIKLATLNEVKANPEYLVVERRTGVDGGLAIKAGALDAANQGKKLFGLFGGSGGNFEPPVPTNNGTGVVNRATIENPTLKDATLAALEVLKQDPDGFFVLVEQGDIDWANHANNFPWMIGTMWDLNEAVKAVVEFVENPFDDIDWQNTLFIVASDHGNSYMRNRQKLGKGELPAAGEIQTNFLPGTTTLNATTKVTYSTGDHTNELVNVYALGHHAERLFRKYEGAWYPGTRIIDNTHLFHILAEAAGVDDVRVAPPARLPARGLPR